MADSEDIQPLVCDNGTGMVKVWIQLCKAVNLLILLDCYMIMAHSQMRRLDLPEMMLQGLCSLALWVALATLG